MSGFRLPGHPRASAAPLRFRFNGQDLEGREGDTLAAALIANGITLVARSFKYHRPRGIVGHGHAETNALVQLDGGGRLVPNALATRVLLVDGLDARSLNCWPSVNFDVGAINDRFARLLSAGFYYKSFMWPSWHLFEPFIRRAAGLGRAPTLPDPDRYDSRTSSCDVLVVGGGIAGLAAARAAAGTGADVVLVEAEPWLGGMTAPDVAIGDGAADDWIARAEAALAAAPNVRLMRRATATGYYDDNLVTVIEELDRPDLRQRVWKLRADRVVLATGAIERPLLFPGNDRPGVMLGGSVHHYLYRHGVAAGRKLAIVAPAREGAALAEAARAAGIAVEALIDPTEGDVEIVGVEGAKAVRALTLREPASGRQWPVACDCIAMSGGWTPAVQLFSQSGGRTRFDPAIGAFVPGESVQAERSAGAARGTFDAAGCVAEGIAAGLWAAGAEADPAPARPGEPPVTAAPSLPLPPPGAKAFVDFQTDVTVDDLRLATRENYRSVEHVKRYTVWGMGVDQGKLGGTNGVVALAALQGAAPGALGTTRYRPPYAPVAFGALAAAHGTGRLFRPWKTLPAHDWHVRQGAAFEDHGWVRPSHYPRAGEDMAGAARREAVAVRNGAGLFDSASLGKIELFGPEAGLFLDRMSLGRPSTIPVGTVRYNLLTNELGTIIDDGVVARLADDHFLLTASSGHTAYVLGWLRQWHQTEWPLDLVILDATAAWAVWTVAGPKARRVLERIDGDIDLSADVFPHNRIRTGTMMGLETRIQRVSFTGETSFEIAVPADQAAAFADMLMTAGAPEGLFPFGLEALDILRLEKGFIYPGVDTDSMTQPLDIGWGKAVARKALDFVGKRSLLHPFARRPGRRTLVGLQPIDPTALPPAGAHIIGGTPHPSQGIVTSSAFSPTLERGLALGLLADGNERMGEAVTIWSEGTTWQAIVAPPCAFDPEGVRMNG